MEKGSKEVEVVAAAQEAVQFAQRHFQLTLDYTDNSIQDVERLLARFHDDLPKNAFQRLFRPAPSPGKMGHTVLMFGSYVGEVLRRRLEGSRWEKDTTDAHGVLCLTTVSVRFGHTPRFISE